MFLFHSTWISIPQFIYFTQVRQCIKTLKQLSPQPKSQPGDIMKPIFKPTIEAVGWDINPEKIEKLKEDLEELGSIEVKFCKSKFFLIPKSNSIIKHAEPSESAESNHVQILLNNKTVAEFYRRSIGFAGIFFEENIPEGFEEKISNILGKHKYYTGKNSWKYFPLIPLAYILVIALFYMIACLQIFMVSSEPSLSAWEIFAPLSSIAAAVCLTLAYRMIFP